MAARRKPSSNGNGSLHEVSEAIGELRSSIKHMASGQETISRMIEEDRKAAAIYRTDMRQDIRALHEKVDPLVRMMPEIENKVEMHERLRLEGRGMRRVVGWLIKLAILAGGAAGYKGAEPWLAKLMR